MHACHNYGQKLKEKDKEMTKSIAQKPSLLRQYSAKLEVY